MERKDRVYYRLGTHLEMLQDHVRCLAYQKAIESVVRDKIVLDVGCGSGILSFFAARAGARRVLAVDMDIPPGTGDVLKDNRLTDRVQFLNGRIQEVELPVESVDVIVSEWMGGMLLMEDMLPAVIYARDRWLRPGGIMLPDMARLFLVPLEDVAGIGSDDFPVLRETSSTQIWVSRIDPTCFLAEPACVLDLDLNKVKEADVRSYRNSFHFKVKEGGILNGFGSWFDVLFSQTRPPVMLSTAPWGPPTHWSQGLWVLPKDIETAGGDKVTGIFEQTAISPSAASFRVEMNLDHCNGKKTTLTRCMEAGPSGMNPAGGNEDDMISRARSGGYRGRDCLWIGCSMSMGALMAAGNGAKEVSILNHSPWAAHAMQQIAVERGLNNVRFLGGIPPADEIRDKEFCLLGAADGSWQALLSHIKVRRALGDAVFHLRFFRRENPWKEFYGFDFSAYAPYDLEMTHKEQALTYGIELTDITGHDSGDGTGKEELIYIGGAGGDYGALNLPGGSYNCVEAGFKCGSVILPLPESVGVDSQTGKQLQMVKLTISILDQSTCRFNVVLSGEGWLIEQDYEQPISSMGHIVRN
ncbi:MAG: methyltransferase domain-containing protein [bacterium]|nr:methyltransferase domain-containing protein [bacterium]